MPGSRILELLAVALLAAVVPAAGAGAAPLEPVDPHFQNEAVLEELESPMAVRFAPAPDGRIFVAEKSGRVLAFGDRWDRDPAVVVDLSEQVHDFWDRGLLGMTLDPAFALNGRLYLLYTRDAVAGGDAPRWGDTCPDPPGAVAAGCVVSGALARVTVNALGVATEVRTLIRDEWCEQFPSHSVGALAFGPDGMLYASAGDGASFLRRDWGQLPGKDGYPSNPCGDPPDEGGMMRSQDVRTTGDPTGLSGAIIRVDPATGEAAPGNPFADGDAGARRLVAYGLRNPFRWAFRPGTDELWIGDVGWHAWEEINVVADADDAVAENFGWPCFEGSAPHAGWDAVPGCRSLPPSQVTPPRFEYAHGREIAPGDGCRWKQGGSISGVAFPSGYGADRTGGVYFSDYSGVCIFAMAPGEDGRPDPRKVSVFARGTGSGGPVELQTGPEGDLYYTYYDPASPSQGSVHRIRHMPGNRAPVAAVSALPSTGPVPLAVDFSAAGTTDPDGDALEYAWDLDGDGAYDDATGVSASRTYGQPARLRAGVRVTDAHGESARAHVTVTPGNTPPRPHIEVPADGAPWSVGERIELRGSAQDDQEAIGPQRLEWVVSLDHCPQGAGGCHAHPIERVPGASGTLVGPEHDYPSGLVLTLTATDSAGLTGTRTVRLESRAARVRVTTDTPGTAVSLDGVVGADVRRTVIAGSRVTAAVEPRQGVGDRTWEFRGWSDGPFPATRELRPAGDVTLSARFGLAARDLATPSTGATGVAGGRARKPRKPLRIIVERPFAWRLAPIVPLVATCTAKCRLSVRATLRADGRRHALPVPRSRARGSGRRFDVRLAPRLRAVARRGLRRGRPVRLLAVLRARGADGTTRTKRIRLALYPV